MTILAGGTLSALQGAITRPVPRSPRSPRATACTSRSRRPWSAWSRRRRAWQGRPSRT